MTGGARRWGGPEDSAAQGPQPASRWEILGAWLHVWTPPRDAAIPPVPWPKVAAGALALAALVAVLMVTAVPAIRDRKDEGARERARQAAADRRVERARLVRDQRATVTPLRPGASLVSQIETAIARGARARVRSGELQAPGVLGASCDAPRPESRGRLGFYCTAVTGRLRGAGRGEVGFPFYAVVSSDRRSFAWCKANPGPGEREAGIIVSVELPPACR